MVAPSCSEKRGAPTNIRRFILAVIASHVPGYNFKEN